MLAETPGTTAPIGVRYPRLAAAWYGLAVLVITTVFAAVNRQVLILVTESLKRDLHIGDAQIGALNGIALTFVAAIATFPLGWLADRVDRRRLLWICVLIWSAATALCGFARDFPELFACSMGIAVGEAVLGPITYTIIPDLFPPGRRITANYVFFLASILGASGGLALSGAIIGWVDGGRASLPGALATMQTWRIALVCVATFGPLLALMIAFIPLKHHLRVVAVVARADGILAYFRAHARTLTGVFFGFGLIAIGWGTVSVWMAVALMRVFHESPANVGTRLGAIGAIGSLLGVLLSGWLVRVLGDRLKERAPIRVSQIGGLIFLVLTPLYLVATSPIQMYAIALVQGVGSIAAVSLSPTLLQLIAPTRMRGRVVAIGGLLYIALGSLSPLAVGLMSDLLPGRPRDLLVAMTIVALPCVALGVALLSLTERTLGRTIAAAAD